MRRSLSLFAVAVALSVVPSLALAQAATAVQSAPAPKQDQKPAPAAADPFSGKWNMAIETPGGQRPATLTIKIDGKKVAGTIASEMGELPIAGELAEGKLAFTLNIDANGQSMSIGFTGTAQKDGSLAGTANMAGQEMAWTATRIKEK